MPLGRSSADPKAPYFGVEINDRSLNDSFRRLAEHLGPKVKSKNQHLELDL